MRKSTGIKKSDRSVIRYAKLYARAILKQSVGRIAAVFMHGKYLLQPVISEEENFKRHTSYYGLAPHNFGSEFTYQGRSYTICGLRCEDSECPIIAKSSDGTKCKFSINTICEAWEQEIPF